jgi:transposase-like protein
VFVLRAPDQVRAHWQRVTAMLRKHFPAAVPVMEAAREDVLAFLHFPQEQWATMAKIPEPEEALELTDADPSAQPDEPIS